MKVILTIILLLSIRGFASELQILGSNFQFTEGPAADAAGNIYFTDIRANRIHKLPTSGKIEVFRENSGGANGLLFDPAGNLLVCEGSNKRVVSIAPNGKVTVVADAFEGKPLNKPNDLWADSKGGIYFTDPMYGRNPITQDGEHVYYILPDRSDIIRVIDDFKRPNGIIGTPDGKALYVADHGDSKVWKYSITAAGTLANKSLFTKYASDGMALDAQGNLYITENAVLVFNPEGNLIREIETPARPTNVTISDHVLYITARSHFCRMTLNQTKPNFVFILSDDQDWTETSVQMHPDMPNSKSQYIETPNLEKLASQGMTFSAAYSPAPVCSPTRISLQTGKSPAQLHWTKAAPVMTATSNCPLLPPQNARQISGNETTIAEMLKTAGYATAHFGKWHLSCGGPENHGYDESDGDTGNQDAAPHIAPNPVDIFGITERANAFMVQHTKSGTPFYMQLSHHALHYPQNADKALLDKYANLSGGSTDDKRVQRMAMAEHLDDGIGLIMQKIEELGIAENTYLIYMSDNGGGGGGGNKAKPGKHKNVRPLTAGKGGLWEGGIRVPLIIRGPGVTSGIYCTARVVGYDLYPTLCRLADVNADWPKDLEGGDIAPLFATGSGTVKRPREELVFHFPHYQGDTPHSAIMLGDYKLMKWYEDDRVKLFDLSKDIGECNDLSRAMPEKTTELKTRLEQYLSDIGARLPRPNPDYDSNKPYVEKKDKEKTDRNRKRVGA
jgi:arylsulfatase A-like enzyme